MMSRKDLAPPNRLERLLPWLLAAFAVLALAVGYLWHALAGEQSARERSDRDRAANKAAVTALASQVEHLGATPVVQPSTLPPKSPEPVVTVSIPGPAGPSGPSGPAGSPGPSGAKGSPGSPGSAGAAGAAGSNGQDGHDGAAGVDGAPGANGKDGAVGSPGPQGPQGEPGEPGATGPAGPQGDPGPTGPAGAPGANGANGQDGTDGQPPVSWTFDVGVRHYTCSRTDPFDPANPTYTCSFSVT